jgi:hypothetical protein
LGKSRPPGQGSELGGSLGPACPHIFRGPFDRHNRSIIRPIAAPFVRRGGLSDADSRRPSGRSSPLRSGHTAQSSPLSSFPENGCLPCGLGGH